MPQKLEEMINDNMYYTIGSLYICKNDITNTSIWIGDGCITGTYGNIITQSHYYSVNEVFGTYIGTGDHVTGRVELALPRA